MISLLLPTPAELRILVRGVVSFRDYEIAPGALPPRVILDQSRYFPTGTPLTYRWGIPHLILLRDSRRIVGSVGGKGLLPEEEEVELGYNVAPDYRNRGIMSQAIRLVIGMAKQDDLGLVAHIEPDNHPSRKVLENNEFTFDATVTWPAGFSLERWRRSPD